LHVVGFFLLLVLVVPRNLTLGDGAVFGLGLGLTAYTLGLRHAFDADHIGAIDNTTRKLMAEGQRPLSVGLLLLARPLDGGLPARLPVLARRARAQRLGRARRLHAAPGDPA
jgi:hypothetical protein